MEVVIPIIEDLSFINPTVIPWGWIISGTVGFFVLCAATIFLVIRSRKNKCMIEELTRPERKALAELEEAFRCWRQQGYLLFLFRVTTAVRTYLEQRFGLNASTQTTSQISESITLVPVLSRAKQDELKNLFVRCDRIKFGSDATIEEELRDLYASACSFVKSTAWRKK